MFTFCKDQYIQTDASVKYVYVLLLFFKFHQFAEIF
jgi:hypothetical protein